jgi:hypothetical protein
MSDLITHIERDILVSPKRCGIILRVNLNSASMLTSGDYACTLPLGHQPDNEHVCVVRWNAETVTPR